MSSYLETIPEDLLFEISTYLYADELLEIYKLFKPRLYDKPSFQYSMYSINFPDVDWIEIIPDQKGYTFEMFVINYKQFDHSYIWDKSTFFNKKEISFSINNIPFYTIDSIYFRNIKKLKFLKFDYNNKFYKIANFNTNNNEVIVNINENDLILSALQLRYSEELFILINGNNKFYFGIFDLVYEITIKDVINIITYVNFN